MISKESILLFLCLLSITMTNAQGQYAVNKGEGLLVKITYAYQSPAGDLLDRFGNNFSVGLGLDYITSESNWIIGIDGSLIFGNEVKTDVLSNLRTPEGFIIANDRVPADIQLRQRGFYVGGLIGKIFPLSEVNKRSGIKVTLSMGLLQHKIRIQDDPVRAVSQLTDEYKKGYDRLTNGLALNEFVGYQLLSTNGRINFYAGLDLTQGFTRSRRDFNFDTRDTETENRIDLLIGFKVGWILPFYFGKGSEEIYY